MVSVASSTFVLFAAVLVMVMVPAVGLFYAGMVRSKNVLNTIIESFVILAIVSVLWILVGYTLVFGSDFWYIIGRLDWVGLQNLPLVSPFTDKVDAPAFVIFQGMFAAITPALINGSIVERARFPALMLFMIVWSIFVYCPIAHWVWGNGGFLNDIDVLDFAGGTVVHMSSGYSALAACLFVGKRKGAFGRAPHNLTISVIGAILLWFGWFGFNGGSALALEKVASNAFLTTNTAAACGTLGWMLIEILHKGKPTAWGIISGAVAGLVGITPAAGYVTVVSAIFIGLVTGFVCYLFIFAKTHVFKYDDSLDVFGIHGIGGTVGALLTGIFASSAIDPTIPNGLLYGNPKQLLIQIAAASVCAFYAFFMTKILLKIVNRISPLRANGKEERLGLDITQHGEANSHF